jgi:DNA-binding CsgD family transcriptional regulator
MSRRADPIAVIEAGYQLGGSEAEWLHGVAAALQPLLDTGHGVCAYTFDLNQPSRTWFDNAALLDMSPSFHAMGIALTEQHEASRLMHLDPEPLSSGTEGFRRMFGSHDIGKPWDDFCERSGIGDTVALRTIEPGGRGVCVLSGATDPRTFDRRSRRLWARVSTHLAAARRMRAVLHDDAHAAEDRLEAALTPSGRLAHAEGPARQRLAREALQEAVRRQERARGRMRRQDPEAATEAWSALVTGRWSLVDRFESDGRRYLVARPNEVRVPDPRALTERERVIAHLAALGKTNKLIAYELGLSPSTVATHLAGALRKLGLRSRTELVATLAGMAPSDDHKETA